MLARQTARRRRLCRALAALAAVACLSIPSPAAEIKSHVTIGYDSFIDRYTILETDTLESIQDFYIGVGNALSARGARTRGSLGNVFRFGVQTIDENLDAEGSFSPVKSAAIDVRSNLHWRHFREGSDYEFGNDYTQANAIFKAKRSIGEHFRLGLRSRVEAVDYREKTDFDYDYRYIDGGAEIEAGNDPGTMALFDVSVGSRNVPDTTALSYDRLLAEIEARVPAGRLVSFQLASAGDRKEYHEHIKSSSWSITSFLDVSLNAEGGAVYSFRGESELLTFDRPDTTFFNTHFLRAGLRVRLPLRSTSSVFIEPRFARMLCERFAEERYWESSCVFGTDISKNDRLWISISYEPGYRNYLLDENELYSDFYLNRVSAMGSLTLAPRMALNLFVTHEPERHSRREDDFALTLVSLDLTKRF